MNKLTNDQVEQLINVVKDKPFLYDKSDRLYKHANMKEKVWKEIGETVGTSAHNCKTAWKSLRDQFVKSVKDMNATSGEEATEKKKYKYFDQLLFMRDIINPRKTSCNYDSYVDDSSTPASEVECDISTEGLRTIASDLASEYGNYNTNTPISRSSARLNKKPRMSDPDELLTNFVKDALSEIKSITTHDVHEGYFVSLASIVRSANLTLRQTRHLQKKLLNFLVDELDKLEGK